MDETTAVTNPNDIIETIEVMLMLVSFGIVYWATLIGRKNGLKLWLFDNTDNVGAAFLIPIGVILMYVNYEETIWDEWIIIGGLLFAGGLAQTFLVSLVQGKNKLEVAVLFLGKVLFASIVTVLVLILFFLFLGSREDKK